MKYKNRLVVALLITVLASLMMVSVASAHNAGHIILSDGRCLNVGSLKDAPVVGAGNPQQLPNGQLDLIPGSGDQYGARLAADQGNSAVLPGECPQENEQNLFNKSEVVMPGKHRNLALFVPSSLSLPFLQSIFAPKQNLQFSRPRFAHVNIAKAILARAWAFGELIANAFPW